LLELQRAGKLPPENDGWIATVQQELSQLDARGLKIAG
jgi:hypothetical protein